MDMDLSKFQRVSSDEKKSTFKHPEGHFVIVAHNKLSNDMRSKLDKIPVSRGAQKFADGGEAKQYDPNSITGNPEATQDEPYGTDKPPEVNAAGAPDPVPSQDIGGSLPPNTLAQKSAEGVSPPLTGSIDQAPPEVNPDQYGLQESIGNQITGVERQSLGEQDVAQAQGEQGTKNIAQEAQYQKQQKSDFSTYQAHDQQLTQDRLAIQKDIAANHLNPKRFIENLSTGDKITTAIGLILGGMGAGLTHGPNMAMGYLEKQIDQDIDAQKNELGKKENLLSHNLQETGDLRAAYNLTKIQNNDILSSQLRIVADQTADPVAKGRMEAIAGGFDQKTAALQHQASMYKMMQGSQGGGNNESQFKGQTSALRMMGQDSMAKDLEAKHVPGVGQASKEVPADIMKELIARQDLQNKIVDLQQFASKNSGTLLDRSVVNTGKAKAALVQDAYRRANAQGVFKESEKEFVGTIVSSDPTQFFEKYRAGKGYQEMGRDNMSTLNNLKAGYGLPVHGVQNSPGGQGFAFKSSKAHGK